MHETSLGITLRDYLTGEQVEQTTYEDLRQALARMLVEELDYPQDQLTPKVNVHYAPPSETDSPLASSSTTPQDDVPSEQCRSIDIVVYDDNHSPCMLLLFCPGQVNTYRRETLAAARLLPNGPVPLALITDTREAILIATHDDTVIREGMRAIPRYEEMLQLCHEHPVSSLSQERLEKERRILHTYSSFIKTCCDDSICMM